MIKNNTVFDYLAQIIVIWGVSVLSLCLFCNWFGEAAYGYSTIFQLGSTGISITTLLQFFLMAIMLTSLRWLFFTNKLIKNVSLLIRSILMFICIILLVGFFAAIFQWFPVNQFIPWMMFFICFFICASISVVVSVIKEKSDNQKMQEALERLRGEDM